MRGRKARGPEIVYEMEEGSEQAKQRAVIILRVIAGDMTVNQAAAELHVTTQRIHDLRAQGVQALVKGFEMQPTGRPRKETEPQEVQDLRADVERLKRELEAAKLREEIELVLPGRGKSEIEKKKRSDSEPRERIECVGSSESRESG